MGIASGNLDWNGYDVGRNLGIEMAMAMLI